jgi:hypothetical protein
MDQSSIERVYTRYGFEIDGRIENIVCCLFKKSRYFGVDIIPLNNNSKTQEAAVTLQEEYSKSGYAANIKYYYKLEDAENELFRSFFSFESTIARLAKKYEDFVYKQTKQLLGNQYEYIESPFEVFDNKTPHPSTSLLKNINGILERNSPQLLIIEAAAGYGKTCAAYEILKVLTNQKNNFQTPLFTELSKNRGAKIFRYILLDEIDLEFPTLNSELVTYEIKNGRIPLIIDGFDELLDKVHASDLEAATAFDEVETMLDTIGGLLENRAKVILTTRKTAIFTGVEFDRWLGKWNSKFEATRFSLKEPRIKDWLGEERFSLVRQYNVPIQYVANPVLLTYLKNTLTDDFLNQLNNPELLVKQYFAKLLERERERQNLIISVEEQYEIFKNVARMLLDLDFTVESKDFFKLIIKEQNSKLLEYTRTLYTGHEKPTIDNLLDTLSNHALLDRKGRNESQIGFINDFVLGIFIGEIICESSIDKIEKDYSYYMVELACTAYKVQNKINKMLLWEKINNVTHKLQPISIFNYDLTLKEAPARDYEELSIYDTTYFNIVLSGYLVKNSVFFNCYFKNCSFDTVCFEGVSFVNCTFDGCVVIDQFYLDEGKEISVIKCKVKDCHILENYSYHEEERQNLFSKTEMRILTEILRVSEIRSHHIANLLKGSHGYSKKQVTRSLNDLIERGFLEMHGNHVVPNINRLSQIKSEIER